MSCYFRHMKEILEEAGIEVSQENKKKVDLLIHEITGTEYKHCPETWKKVKEEIGEGEKRKAFVMELKARYNAS